MYSLEAPNIHAMARWLHGVLRQALPQLHELFERLPAASAAADADVRFDHVCKCVWLQIKESSDKAVVIASRSM